MLPKLFIIICILISSYIFTTHSSGTQCLPHQKTLLLQLRNELDFDSHWSRKLVRWNQTDDESISGGIGDSSSLFRLVYLQKLNLAYNDFSFTNPIPRGIQNLTYLTHLNLSNAGFGGQVPAEMLSLKRLVSLVISNDFSHDIPSNFNDLSLKYPNLEMVVQNLTGLRELYLDDVNIASSDERRNWSHIISYHLPNLTSLSLCDCDLSGSFAKSFSQLHSLSILRLNLNNPSTTVPDLFCNFSSLTVLSLVDCNLKDLSMNEELSTIHSNRVS